MLYRQSYVSSKTNFRDRKKESTRQRIRWVVELLYFWWLTKSNASSGIRLVLGNECFLRQTVQWQQKFFLYSYSIFNSAHVRTLSTEKGQEKAKKKIMSLPIFSKATNKFWTFFILILPSVFSLKCYTLFQSVHTTIFLLSWIPRVNQLFISWRKKKNFFFFISKHPIQYFALICKNI